jgi:hypothetical protein
MTCPASSLESAEIRRKHVRNVEVGGSSPLTSTNSKVQVDGYTSAILSSLRVSSSRAHPAAHSSSRVIPRRIGPSAKWMVPTAAGKPDVP